MQQNDEAGPFIQTVSGNSYHFNAENGGEVDIRDIASSLSRLCRFNGHLKDEFRNSIYSVAQHSVYVLWDLEKRLGKGHAASMFALLHDAPEAYVTDVPTPLKGMLTEYKSIEDKCERNVMEALNVPVYKYIEVEVKVSDVRLLYAEAAAITNIPLLTFGLETPPIDIKEIDPDFYLWGPADARRMFLQEYERVSGVKLDTGDTSDDAFTLIDKATSRLYDAYVTTVAQNIFATPQHSSKDTEDVNSTTLTYEEIGKVNDWYMANGDYEKTVGVTPSKDHTTICFNDWWKRQKPKDDMLDSMAYMSEIFKKAEEGKTTDNVETEEEFKKRSADCYLGYDFYDQGSTDEDYPHRMSDALRKSIAEGNEW